jgi:hypothetical protein
MANDEFQALFDRFKAILAPYAAKMHLSGEQPGMYGVDMAPDAGQIVLQPHRRSMSHCWPSWSG